MIQLEEVSKTYALDKGTTVTAVCDVALEVERGEFVLITGRSGAGKTTLLNLVGGLARPTGGQVLWQGADLWDLTDAARARLRNQKIGFIFQFPSLLPALNVLENVLLPTAFGPPEARVGAYDRAHELLQKVELSDKSAALPRQLSAGQQQRVVVARSLINEPDLLLADEPTSDLDEQTEEEVMALLRELHATRPVTILMVSHTRRLAAVATRHVEMANGCITAINPGEVPNG
jgi:ABC-type lipoprotein export system ATPase subunit